MPSAFIEPARELRIGYELKRLDSIGLFARGQNCFFSISEGFGLPIQILSSITDLSRARHRLRSRVEPSYSKVARVNDRILLIPPSAESNHQHRSAWRGIAAWGEDRDSISDGLFSTPIHIYTSLCSLAHPSGSNLGYFFQLVES